MVVEPPVVPMSSTEDLLCRGGKPGDPCDCEEFSPSENPKRCLECTHGESKHRPSRASNAPSLTPVPAVPASSNLAEIFGDISGTIPRSTPLPTGGVSHPTGLRNGIVSRTAARTEALSSKATGSRMSQPIKVSKRALTSTDRKVRMPFDSTY